MKLKFYTSLKSGEARIKEIQEKALGSWNALGADVECLEGPVDFIDVARRAADCLGTHQIVAWVNADIVFPDFQINRLFEYFKEIKEVLIIGQRTDCLPSGERHLHRPSGMDYFFFKPGMFKDLPRTIMGRGYCDSALVAYCLRRGIPVVDATAAIGAFHQWHDYGHCRGGKVSVMSGEEAQSNKRENGLGDWPPNIADADWMLGCMEHVDGLSMHDESGRDCISEGAYSSWTIVKNKRKAKLRSKMPQLWNILTRGGLYWGRHIDGAMTWATRSDLTGWSKNANARFRPMQLAKECFLELITPRRFDGAVGAQRITVPEEIVARVVRYVPLWRYPWAVIASALRTRHLATGFGFPELVFGCVAKICGCRWTLYLWDPPSLTHRDRSRVLRSCIDFAFRLLARWCDKLVLSIHPGLLDEIGLKHKNVEYRMQDAFEGNVLPSNYTNECECEYDFGVLGNWSEAKGGPLMAMAMGRIGAKCLWIGNSPCGAVLTPRLATCERRIRDDQGGNAAGIEFAGRLSQDVALELLKKCRVLVVPYLNVPSLKWNYVLKIFEYMQLGRPILASDNPGNVAVAARFPDRITLFKSGDVDDFIAQAKSLLCMNGITGCHIPNGVVET